MTNIVAQPVVNRPEAREDAEDFVLRILDLEKSYTSGFWRRSHKVLRGITFYVPRGSIFALLGHNGAGKTTTLKAILGLVQPNGGSIEVFGRDHRVIASRARIGYLPETPFFYEHLTGSELLEFFACLLGIPGSLRRQRIADVLDQVGLARGCGLKLGKYSKGMRQRIGLAQALLNDPELLILDEPMSGLDPMGRRQVRNLLRDLRAAGKTILLSSHIVPDVEALADQVAILGQGLLQGVHELNKTGGATSFAVTLDRPPSGPEAEGLLAHCHCRTAPGENNEFTVHLKGIDLLYDLLAMVLAQNNQVRRISTRRTGLEDLLVHSLAGPSAGRLGGAASHGKKPDEAATGPSSFQEMTPGAEFHRSPTSPERRDS